MAIYRTTKDDATVVNFGSEIWLVDEGWRGYKEGTPFLWWGEGRVAAVQLFCCL